MDKIKKLAELIRDAQNIACLTGAGMSTESGIPDYRSSSGLYNTLTSEEVFDINRFNRDPSEFYKVSGPLYCSIVNAQPNAGHLALAELETKFHKNVSIATQNIDSLHLKAGSTKVFEVHGTMRTLTCRRCGAKVVSDDYLPLFQKGETLYCKCGSVFKPDITFYGENLPEEAFSNAITAFRRCDLAIVLGTSLVVYPAAGIPSQKPYTSKLVIINRSETSMDEEADLVINDSIGAVLPKALELL